MWRTFYNKSLEIGHIFTLYSIKRKSRRNWTYTDIYETFSESTEKYDQMSLKHKAKFQIERKV